MRSFLAILTVLALASACSDDKQPTSPATARPSVGIRSDANTKNGVGEGVGTPQAKPTDEVGFTTASILDGPVVTVPPGEYGGAYAICPVGKASISGGYQFTDFPGTPPFVVLSTRTSTNTQTGWLIAIDNTRAGASTVKYRANVICVS